MKKLSKQDDMKKLSKQIDKNVAEMLEEDSIVGRWVRLNFGSKFYEMLDSAKKKSRQRKFARQVRDGPMAYGTVTDKEYQSAWDETSMMKIGDVDIPQTVHHDEEFQLRIDGWTSKGVRKAHWIVVSRYEYGATIVGQKWGIFPRPEATR